MPGFQFELSQLVNVPGKDQQGRVSARMEFVTGENVYQVQWLDHDLTIRQEMVHESHLIEAQKPKPAGTATLKVEVDDGDLVKTTAAVEKLTAAARDCEATINRIPRNVLNLGKRNRSKSRSKRR